MKRFLIFALIAVLLLGLCACTVPETVTTGENTLPAPTGDTHADTTPPTENNQATKNVRPSTAQEGVLRVYSLKGPTSMGLATLLRDSEAGKTEIKYESTICAAADEVTAALVNGSADVALLPANAAATLYNKAGGFSVVAINTLGVLYVVENGDTVERIDDLAGKTVCLTGKGTTPEYALRYLLAARGIEDQVTLEFKSEAQEVVAAMSENVAMIGVLPQPFATAALMQNEALRIAIDLNSEWNTVTSESSMVTGVTVVRNEILEKYPEMVAVFLKDAAEGVDNVNSDPAAAAELIVNMGIVAKAPIAEKAIPFCNLVCITGEGMKDTLSGYLKTLYDQNPKAVGEKLPDDAFYYTGDNR